MADSCDPLGGYTALQPRRRARRRGDCEGAADGADDCWWRDIVEAWDGWAVVHDEGSGRQ